jgi:copper chaperone CopZ
VAVEQVEHVTSVESDMNQHTITVGFDDEKVGLERIVAALNDAGYVVKERTKVE